MMKPASCLLPRADCQTGLLGLVQAACAAAVVAITAMLQWIGWAVPPRNELKVVALHHIFNHTSTRTTGVALGCK